MKKWLGFLAGFLVAPALADNYTVQGSWTDPTPTGPEYVPQYHAQCQVDAVQVWEDLTLTSPDFSTALVFNPGQVLECRAKNVNVVIPATPIESNWSAWIQGSVATAPSDPSTIILIQIHHLP